MPRRLDWISRVLISLTQVRHTSILNNLCIFRGIHKRIAASQIKIRLGVLKKMGLSRPMYKVRGALRIVNPLRSLRTGRFKRSCLCLQTPD